MNIFRFNKILSLYLFSAITLAIVVYIVPVIGGFTANTWAEFYQMLGRLIGIWGLLFGTGVILYAFSSILNYLYTSTTSSLILRCTKIELILICMFLMNIVAMVNGIIRSEPLTYVIGDTLKGSFIPLFYLWIKKSLPKTEMLVSFVKIVLITETILFILFSITDLIPFAQSTRTFLYTISFTLFYEEEKPILRILFAMTTLFALFIVMTTGAFRGTVLIFTMIVALNIVMRYRAKISPLFVIGTIFTLMILGVAISTLNLDVEKNVTSVSNRFESTLQTKNKKNYGLEESVFQRVGEGIDVIRSFQESNPVYLLIGFGNGAILNNVLITPSERSIYHSNQKHNIYITLLGVLFRQGIVGLFLYVLLFAYLLDSLRVFYRNRKYVTPNSQTYVYLKVLILYHFSVVLYSFVAYLFVGNIVIAFTIPLHIILRQHMEKEANSKQVSEITI